MKNAWMFQWQVVTSNLNIDKCNWIASSNLKAKIELTVKC